MNLNDAIRFAQFVQAAYAGGDAGEPVYNPPFGYNVITNIYGNDLATDQSPSTGNDYVPFGYVAQSPDQKEFVVAIRGTDNLLEWIQDARFDKVACPILHGSGQTEDGFTSVFLSMAIQPNANAPSVADFVVNQAKATAGSRVVVTGHSLGAALATLVSFAIEAGGVVPSAYTYESPNVGDSLFAQTYESLIPNAWRVVIPQDIVTHVPPGFILGYQPVGATFSLIPGALVKRSIPCYHALDTVLFLLGRMAGQNLPLDANCQP